jgi:hypothetical protein
MSWSSNYTKVEVAQPQTSSGSIKGKTNTKTNTKTKS